MTTPAITPADMRIKSLLGPIPYAIARMEGYFASPLSRAARNNNPGDIEWGPFARAHGADRVETLPPGSVPRFAHFPTPEAGCAALCNLLAIRYAGLTITAMMGHYAPPSENDTGKYADFIGSSTGLSVDHIITDADIYPEPVPPPAPVLSEEPA